jgi:hypothetical protein
MFGAQVTSFNVPGITYEADGAEGVLSWVARWVRYAPDTAGYGEIEYWATPEETYWSRSGDCEDYAILTLYLLERDVGVSGWLILGLDGEHPDEMGHAWIELDGVAYEPRAGRPLATTKYSEVKRLTLGRALRLAGAH